MRFWLNDELIEPEGVLPSTTLLRFLRDHLGLTGTKEGCAEGDCGACTVAVLEPRGEGATFRAVNACLLLLPMVHGKRVYTVEALRDRGRGAEGYHPVQRAMVERRGSQCGFCTPGVVMSLFEECYRDDIDSHWQIEDQLAGNLCRCTGYRPLREAAHDVAGLCPDDRFMAELRNHRPANVAFEACEGQGQVWHQPANLNALLALRAQWPQAVLVAGGTDLGLQVTKAHRRWPRVISVEAVDVLRRLEQLDGGWLIGAGVTLTRLAEVMGPRVPALDAMLRVFGSRQVRSRATVGGNLANASPIGDLAPVLLALGAELRLVSQRGERSLPLAEFFLGYRQTALAADEVLLSVWLPDSPHNAFSASYKVSKRRELDISICSAGMYVELERGQVSAIRLAYGGMAATPARALSTEAALLGQPWSQASVQAALPRLADDFQPLSDHRGSADYRARLARNLLRAFLQETT